MESLIKQTRARFGSFRQENKEESSSTRDRNIPPQKTQSFREKKRSQSWLRRQLSRQMSWDNDFSSTDYPTAVAAAAYAIQSLEDSKFRDQKEETPGPEQSLGKKKSKVEDTKIPPEPLKSALKLSDETSKKNLKDADTKVSISTTTSQKMPEKTIGAVPSTKKKLSFADNDETISKKSELPAIEKAPERAPSMSRPPTPANKDWNITIGSRPEIARPKPERQPTGRATVQPVETIGKGTTKPGPEDSMADAWEKEEIASLRERYEKLRATIDNWEAKKKTKAKRKIEKIEADLDKRRVKSVKSYRNEIQRIQEIAAGARAQAEQNRRNEESKVKERANKIRSTGKIPATCLCF